MTRAGERPIYAFEGFHVDAQRRVLSRSDGDPIPLAPKVFDTLLYFVEHQGELLDKRTLLEAIWPHVIVEENNLNQSISTLRRVLGERPGEHRFIVTEPGRGYRFVASVAQSQTSEGFEPAITEREDAVAALAAERAPRSGSQRAVESRWGGCVGRAGCARGSRSMVDREPFRSRDIRRCDPSVDPLFGRSEP